MLALMERAGKEKPMSASNPPETSSTLRLYDGRALGYAEVGKSAGSHFSTPGNHGQDILKTLSSQRTPESRPMEVESKPEDTDGSNLHPSQF